MVNNVYDTKCMQSKMQRCLYIMLHMTRKMQEMHKGKIYICYKGAPTPNLRNQTNTCLSMRSPRRCLKMSAQTYQEFDVWPHRRQVQE
jgi:hypothetical protein